MYMKMKELSWKENSGIQNIGIEDYKGNRVRERRQVLKTWENYSSEFYNRPTRPGKVEV